VEFAAKESLGEMTMTRIYNGLFDLENPANWDLLLPISHVSFDFSFDGLKNKIDDLMAVLR